MKVGSLVECVELMAQTEKNLKYISLGYRFPVIKQVYTVRAVIGTQFVLLEEIVNPVIEPFDEEPAFPMRYFRELQPPMDLSFIEEMQMTEQAKVFK